jgi:hypothetical protein
MTTEDLIRPIITGTYGDNGLSRAVVYELAERIDRWPDTIQPNYGSQNLRDLIMNVCWHTFTGGMTAEYVADSVMDMVDALKERENG